MSDMPSKFIWYELMTTDLAAAEAFYKAVVGWNTEAMTGLDFTYVVLKTGEIGVGGMMTVPTDAGNVPPCWIGYIYADDVDAAVASLKAAGGTVHREAADIPDIGRFAVVADPQGAAFILFKPMGEGGPEAAFDAPGNIGWRELYAADLESAFDFYSGQFGWTKDQAIPMGEMGIYQLFATGGEGPSGGMMTKPAEVPVPCWIFYFNVDDIDAAAARVTGNGGKLLMEPMAVPGDSWVVQCMDPQGAVFALAGRRK